jgi:hypothetical protein
MLKKKAVIKKVERLLFNLTKGSYNDEYQIYLSLIEINLTKYFNKVNLENTVSELKAILKEEKAEIEKDFVLINRFEKDIYIAESIMFLKDKRVVDYELIINDTIEYRGNVKIDLTFSVIVKDGYEEDAIETKLTVETVVLTSGYGVLVDSVVERKSKINGISIENTSGTFTPFIKMILEKTIDKECKKAKNYSEKEILKISKVLESIEE